MGANKAIEKAKNLIIKRYYRHARDCIKMSMELYPDLQHGFGMFVISETLYYGNIKLSNFANAFDYYSVLHLSPSSTQAEVKQRVNELKKEVSYLINMGFPGSTLADSLLDKAANILCNKSMRSYFDNKRIECVFLDWPQRLFDNKTTSSSSYSFRESYLEWKPPSYLDLIPRKKQKVAHDHNCVDGFVLKEEDDPSGLSPELSILKRKVFDEMPQNPHYTPLDKYSSKVREGMIFGLEMTFTQLCEEIRNLVDIESFWCGLDGFNEQISELKEMGFNVEKVSERIDILKSIAECERASKDAAEEAEDEVISLQSRISELQAEIKEAKDIIANRKSKIKTFKKDSSDAVAEFASIVKSKWV